MNTEGVLVTLSVSTSVVVVTCVVVETWAGLVAANSVVQVSCVFEEVVLFWQNTGAARTTRGRKLKIMIAVQFTDK
jgi:hypothetical protein